jgi:hypothetical protein
VRWGRRRRVYVDSLPQPHDGRYLAILLVLVVAVLGGVYAVGYVAAGDKVPARTTVAGVDIGSMSRQQASDVLVHAFAGRLREPLRVTAAGRSLDFVPQTGGMSFDVEATLDRAMGGSDWNPHHMLEVVEGGGAVDPIYRADLLAFAAALKPLADRVERRPVSAAVHLQAAKPVVSAAVPGRRLDVGSAAEAVAAALADDNSSARLPLSPVEPALDETAARTFVDNELGPALRGPVHVSVGGESVRLTPAQFGPALRVTVDGGSYRLSMQPDVLWAHTHTLLSRLPGRPVDARVVFRQGRPVVLSGQRGSSVDRAAWADAVFTAATRSAARHATAVATVVEPRVTTSEARALLIRTNVGAASETAQAHLAGGLSLAARHLDSTVVLPGATFSYVRTVGAVGAATVLTPLGAATQTAAERAGMTITRWPRVSPSGHDLGFRNTTERPVLIHCWVAPQGPHRTGVFVQFWSSHSR